MKLNELSAVVRERNKRKLLAFFQKYSRSWASTIMKYARMHDFPADKKAWAKEHFETIFNSAPFFDMNHNDGTHEKYDEYVETYLENEEELFDILWKRLSMTAKFRAYEKKSRE